MFRARYGSLFPAPTLRAGDVLVLDNLTDGLREWLAERGVQGLFLPPYSPDFSPIAQAWSKLKTAVRAPQAQCREALRVAVDGLPAKMPTTDSATGTTTSNLPKIG